MKACNHYTANDGIREKHINKRNVVLRKQQLLRGKRCYPINSLFWIPQNNPPTTTCSVCLEQTKYWWRICPVEKIHCQRLLITLHRSSTPVIKIYISSYGGWRDVPKWCVPVRKNSRTPGPGNTLSLHWYIPVFLHQPIHVLHNT